jgi:hypothetical protein
VPKKEGDQSKTTQTAHNPFGASTLAVNQQNPPAAGEEKKRKKIAARNNTQSCPL